jgi:hypothetical protein
MSSEFVVGMSLSLNNFDRQPINSNHSPVVHNGKLPARLNMELLRLLQQQEETIFTPKVAYDGQKIIFSSRKLPLLGRTDSQLASQRVIILV